MPVSHINHTEQHVQRDRESEGLHIVRRVDFRTGQLATSWNLLETISSSVVSSDWIENRLSDLYPHPIDDHPWKIWGTGLDQKCVQ